MALFSATGMARAEGELHLYNWANYTSPALIAKFEEAHEVKVTITGFASNAAALARLREGGHGFDLVVASADYIKSFIEEGLLAQSRPDRMENFANVAAPWRDPPWDPGRQFSVPWQWGGIGMVVDAEAYDGDIDTSAIIFDPPPALEGRIGVAPQMNEIIAMALLYVGARPCTTEEAVLEQVREVLAAARPKWRSIGYGIAGAMRRGEIGAAAYWDSAARRARHATPLVRLGYPREGFALWMDSVAVLKDAANDRNARLFLDFIMMPENAALISAHAGHANGIDGSGAFLPDEMKGAPGVVVPAEATEAGVFVPPCPAEADAVYTAIWAGLTE
jgi:spermidine/putrescine transport system substrate-binding protein